VTNDIINKTGTMTSHHCCESWEGSERAFKPKRNFIFPE